MPGQRCVPGNDGFNNRAMSVIDVGGTGLAGMRGPSIYKLREYRNKERECWAFRDLRYRDVYVVRVLPEFFDRDAPLGVNRLAQLPYAFLGETLRSQLDSRQL